MSKRILSRALVAAAAAAAILIGPSALADTSTDAKTTLPSVNASLTGVVAVPSVDTVKGLLPPPPCPLPKLCGGLPTVP